jgi:hypothetical protein
MRKLLIIAFLNFYWILCFSQDFLIENSNQYDLQLGLDNPVSFIVSGVPCDSLILKTNNGVIHKREEGSIDLQCNKAAYFVRPTEKNTCTLSIYKKDKGDTFLIGEKKFIVRELPRLIGYVAGMTGGLIEKKYLSAQQGIPTGFDRNVLNIDIEYTTKVINYSVVIIRGNKVILVNDYKGNRFPPKLIDSFKNLQDNDKLVFYGIQAIGQDGILRKIDPLEFTITEN